MNTQKAPNTLVRIAAPLIVTITMLCGCCNNQKTINHLIDENQDLKKRLENCEKSHIKHCPGNTTIINNNTTIINNNTTIIAVTPVQKPAPKKPAPKKSVPTKPETKTDVTINGDNNVVIINNITPSVADTVKQTVRTRRVFVGYARREYTYTK